MEADMLVHTWEGSELYVVPAIHYHQYFAREIHRICAGPETLPDAIAVELGSQSALAAREWIRELYLDKCRNGKLPAMLGILKRNRLIRPSLREKAVRLQQEHCIDLNELPSDVLFKELDFSSHSLLLLSPTDSIIEAVRCGIELGIPVHGVDLEDTAGCVYKHVHMELPFHGHGMPGYVKRNAAYANGGRIEETDLRREIAMAARLKALMQKYRRVLFTCGIGHWLSIRELLRDPSLRPALIPGEHELQEGIFRRVVVHPCMAAQYMDMFPAASLAYEAHRRPVTSDEKADCDMSPSDPVATFYEQLDTAYEEYARKCSSVSRGASRSVSREAFRDFEQYLHNLCLIENRPYPDMFMALRTSKEMVNGAFTKVLAETLMHFPWATPEDFPGCPLIGPDDREGMGEGRVRLTGEGDTMLEEFHVSPYHPGGMQGSSPGEIPYDWGKKQYRSYEMLTYTWMPWDRLVTSMSYKAADSALRILTGRKAVAFEGSMLNGIDVKRTVRAHARGEETLYVRDAFHERAHQSGFMGRFPVVWILDLYPPEQSELSAQFLYASHLMPHIVDKDRFEDITENHNVKIVAIIGYRARVSNGDTFYSPTSVTTDNMSGMLIFQPLPWTNKQHALWVEATGYERNPICFDASFDNWEGSIPHFYRERHGLGISEYHWASALILMALPYARDALTVVAPAGYRVEGAVHQRAQQFKVQLNMVDLALFSKADLNRMAVCNFVHAQATEPEYTFSEEVENLLGEKQTDNLELVPEEILAFGNLD